MKIQVPSIHEIKKELGELDKNELIALCVRLGKFKAENKELMSYLLFHSGNESVYVDSVKKEMESQLHEMNASNMYLAKKTIRKVLRTANKHIRFSGNTLTELELRIHFCKILKETKIPIAKHPVLLNLYNNQVKKIGLVLLKIDEDLRFDFKPDINFIQKV